MDTCATNEKYKDDQPLHTIQRVRGILHSLGILTTEKWFQTGDSMYSVRVEIAGTHIGQNGKGVTAEYALASGYGEFMERLQLGTLYNAAELGPEALAGSGFYYAPDEQYVNKAAVLSRGGPVVEYLLTATADTPETASGPEDLLLGKLSQWYGDTSRIAQEALLTEWAGETPPGCPADFVCLPYYSLKQKQLFAIPVPMLRLPYLHNGAAAGNSPYEALVQAMSEILERYVHKQILSGKVAPPTIPPAYWERNPSLKSMVRQIEDHGYQVLVKDCSLGLGLPIVGVVITDKRKGEYLVKLGVHPSFDIALERCLTEAAQGRELFRGEQGWLTKFRYHDPSACNPRNVYNVLRTGVGSYPQTFFSNSNSCGFSGYPCLDSLDNKALLGHLVGILLKITPDLFVRDVSFLGFSAFQVIAPGISEVFDFGRDRLSREKLRRDVRVIVKDLRGASEPELRKVVSYLVKRAGYVFETDCLGQLPGVPLRADFPWNSTPNYELIGAVLYKMGKTTEAAGILRQLAHSQGSAAGSDRTTYYYAVCDYLAARSDGREDREAGELLTLFYQEELVAAVRQNWQEPLQALDSFFVLSCWDCPDCSMRKWCSREKLLPIHEKLKRRMAANPLNQLQVERIFDEVSC